MLNFWFEVLSPAFLVDASHVHSLDSVFALSLQGPAGGPCADINECSINNGGCDVLALCTNTIGSRTCGACPPGYRRELSLLSWIVAHLNLLFCKLLRDCKRTESSCVIYRNACLTSLCCCRCSGNGYSGCVDVSSPVVLELNR